MDFILKAIQAVHLGSPGQFQWCLLDNVFLRIRNTFCKKGHHYYLCSPEAAFQNTHWLSRKNSLDLWKGLSLKSLQGLHRTTLGDLAPFYVWRNLGPKSTAGVRPRASHYRSHPPLSQGRKTPETTDVCGPSPGRPWAPQSGVPLSQIPGGGLGRVSLLTPQDSAFCPLPPAAHGQVQESTRHRVSTRLDRS